jgi:hypothetical protein
MPRLGEVDHHKGNKAASVKRGAANEFHISKPDGWPAGDYQVEISLDDKPVGTKKFSVN